MHTLSKLAAGAVVYCSQPMGLKVSETFELEVIKAGTLPRKACLSSRKQKDSNINPQAKR